jgi:hypothetical protein
MWPDSAPVAAATKQAVDPATALVTLQVNARARRNDGSLDTPGQGESARRKAPSNSGALKGFCRTATTFFVSSGSTA